jgi:hypothetical protein
MGLALAGVLWVSPVGAGVLDVSWTAPTENIDGSPLTDLASYRVHYGPVPTCPGMAVSQVVSPTPSPESDQVVSLRLTGLTTGALYYVSVTAVNTSGVESACADGASAIAQDNFSVSPSGTVSFGDVSVGSFADQVFTVQNTRGGTVSGSVSASGSFSVVSGSPFTLAGSGATQDVTVRFVPTAPATASTNVDFTADGDTISRLMTGSTLDVAQSPTASSDVPQSPTASQPTASQPTIVITSPTSNPTYSTLDPFITLGGTASDAVGVTWVMWIDERGVSGMAVGTTNWTASGIALHLGTNVLTVAAQNVAGYISTTTLTVTLSIASIFPLNADPVIAASMPVKATHLAELRTALSDAYRCAGRTPPTYTDPIAVAGLTIKANHLNELRDSVRALQ